MRICQCFQPFLHCEGSGTETEGLSFCCLILSMLHWMQYNITTSLHCRLDGSSGILHWESMLSTAAWVISPIPYQHLGPLWIPVLGIDPHSCYALIALTWHASLIAINLWSRWLSVTAQDWHPDWPKIVWIHLGHHAVLVTLFPDNHLNRHYRVP